MAFGTGFGAVEALVVGFASFLNILIFVLMPEIIATLPVEMQAELTGQLSLSTLFIFPAIIERIAAILLHVFASVLVVYSVRSGQLKYLGYSIIYKTVVDGIIPFLVYTINPSVSLANSYIIEIPFIILGAVGYFGIKWLKKKKW